MQQVPEPALVAEEAVPEPLPSESNFGTPADLMDVEQLLQVGDTVVFGSLVWR